MDGKQQNKTLSPRQRQAIVALLACSTVEEAAQTAKVSRSRLYIWMKDPNFAVALEAARTEQTDEALALLRGSLVRSVWQLNELLDTGPSIALRAAQILLEHAMKLREEQFFAY